MKFNNIKIKGDKFTLKQENTFFLVFENVNGLPLDIEYRLASRKHKRLQCTLCRFQVDAISLVETQINLALLPHAFSIRDKSQQQFSLTISKNKLVWGNKAASTQEL